MISPFIDAREAPVGRELFAEKTRSNAKTEKKDPFAAFLQSAGGEGGAPSEAAETESPAVTGTPGNLLILLKTIARAAEDETDEAEPNAGPILAGEGLKDVLTPSVSPDEDENEEEVSLEKLAPETDPSESAGAGAAMAAAGEALAAKPQRSGEEPANPEPAKESLQALNGRKAENPETAPEKIIETTQETTGKTTPETRLRKGEAEGEVEGTFKDNPDIVKSAGREKEPNAAFKKTMPEEKEQPLQQLDRGEETPSRGQPHSREATPTPAQAGPAEARTVQDRGETREQDREAVTFPGIEARARQPLTDGGKSGDKNREDDGHSSRGRLHPEGTYINRSPEQRSEGLRPGASLPPAGFARELQLAGRGGAALEEGVGNVVRFIRAEGGHRASIIVDPPALGRVEVELVSGVAGVEASIRVASEQLKLLVQDHIAQLRLHLQQQGVQLAEFTVDISDNGREGRDGQGSEGGSRNLRGSAGLAGDGEETPIFRVDLEQGLLHWMA